MSAIQRFGVGSRISQAVACGDFIFLAAQIADDITQDIGGQTRQVLAKIDSVLHEAASDKTKILKVDIWLADIGDFDAMNREWDAWIIKDRVPARVTVESRLVPGYRIEAAVVAMR
jgi:enamine deaminase RidA (YjgF/YER057c/UK114 family)